MILRDLWHMLRATQWLWPRLIGVMMAAQFAASIGFGMVASSPLLMRVYFVLVSALGSGYVATVLLVAARNCFTGQGLVRAASFLVEPRRLFSATMCFLPYFLLVMATIDIFSQSTPMQVVWFLSTAWTALALPFAVLSRQATPEAFLSGLRLLRQPRPVRAALAASTVACVASFFLGIVLLSSNAPIRSGADWGTAYALGLVIVTRSLLGWACVNLAPMLFIPASFCLYWRLAVAPATELEETEEAQT